MAEQRGVVPTIIPESEHLDRLLDLLELEVAENRLEIVGTAVSPEACTDDLEDVAS